jgi:uncharacterized protein (TIGR02001 family)
MKKVQVLRMAALAAVAVGVSGIARAQEFEVSAGADVVSSYVWRGLLTPGGAHIQPSLGLSYGGFSLGAWGSTDISGQKNKEFDISLGYSIGNVSLGVTDYWWSGEGAPYGYYKDTHLYEGTIGYSVGGFSATWSTFFAGDKAENDEGELKEQFSTFIEASYNFDVKGVSFTPAIGIAPWKGMYHTLHEDAKDDRGFTLATISLTASKEIKITDSYSLPIFSQVVIAPEKDETFLVFGISF